MQKKLYLLTIILLAVISFGQTSFAQQLPDLTIQRVGVDGQNRLYVTVVNVGKGSLPDSVWTNINPKSPSITYKVNGKNWGGVTLWKADELKRLKYPKGRFVYVSNYVIKSPTVIEVTVDRFNQVRESNEGNNTKKLTVLPRKAGSTNSSNQNSNSNRYVAGSFFSNTYDFNLNKIKTIYTMQEHIQWVSKENEQDGIRNLKSQGFKVLGGGMLSAAGLKNERIRAYVATKGNVVVVAFRGTKAVGNGGQTFANTIITDGNVLQVKPSFFFRSSLLPTNTYRSAKVHGGFNKAYKQIRPQIINALRGQDGKHIYAFGHSLGGALATLFATDIGINYNRTYKSLTHIVSGSPRVGDANYRSLFERAVRNNLRVVVNRDPIPTIPNFYGVRKKTKYQHVGRLLQIGNDGVIVTNNIDVTFNIRSFGKHSNPTYLKAVNKLKQKSERNSAVYRRGTQLIINTANKERELSDKFFKRL